MISLCTEQGRASDSSQEPKSRGILREKTTACQGLSRRDYVETFGVGTRRKPLRKAFRRKGDHHHSP